MPQAFTVRVGDWVRFQRGGALVIGEVYVITDVGTVSQSDVLETRPVAPTEGK